jgi:hypothetical protein
MLRGNANAVIANGKEPPSIHLVFGFDTNARIHSG